MAIGRRLRHLAFQSLYGPLARAYDLVSRLAFAGEWARWQAAVGRFADRAPIVELGCGTGQGLAALAAQGLSAYGVDAAWPMLRQARHRAAGHLARGRAQQLPFRSASIGTLISVFPTAYILDPATWAEAARVLVPAGRLVIIAHGWLEPDTPWRALLATAHAAIYGGRGSAAAIPFPDLGLPTIALTERTRHGYLVVYVASKP